MYAFERATKMLQNFVCASVRRKLDRNNAATLNFRDVLHAEKKEHRRATRQKENSILPCHFSMLWIVKQLIADIQKL